MMKFIYGVIFGLILFIGAAGYNWAFKTPGEPSVLTVSAGPRGSDSYTLMSEIAQVADRHSDKIKLRVVAGRNSSVNISRLHKGIIDLATVEANTPAYSSIQLVSDLFSDYFLLISRSDSGVQHIRDLIDQRIAIPEEGSSGSRSFWSVIDHYRLPPQGFRTFSVPREQAVEKFLRGDVNSIFMVSSLRDPFLRSFLEETQLRGLKLRFIPIDQANAMALKRPFLTPKEIVRGAFDGAAPLPAQDIVTPSVKRLLVAKEDANPEAITELVRVIFENRLDLLIRMPLSSSIEGDTGQGGASLAYHPGAQSFYDKDKPSFLQENAEPMALIVTVFAMLISTLLALRRSIGAKAKNRADSFNERLLEISAKARVSTNRNELQSMKYELTTVLETIVHALDNDQITEEGFQAFAFLWGSVRDQINERQAELFRH